MSGIVYGAGPKGLTRYLTGGPISDHRILRADNDEVVFLARPKKSSRGSTGQRTGMNAPRPYRLGARQFMQRWCLHILPKNFIRTGNYGGYYGSKRQEYLQRCRKLLSLTELEPTVEPAVPEDPELEMAE